MACGVYTSRPLLLCLGFDLSHLFFSEHNLCSLHSKDRLYAFILSVYLPHLLYNAHGVHNLRLVCLFEKLKLTAQVMDELYRVLALRHALITLIIIFFDLII